ncbi:Exodeoxyribonuclease I [Candidatus Purcelliella pentastirinorum]|uniref:Exodeoxyribonuclease I n=1 Tax=Candidatus Purcelliella pentastirinorum TaxID=472834 RepID=A0A346DZ63_9ENTR|nr:exodeoxyribonuclease I [Candidatus Purcelliella pentastirinorum]AXN02018.1 Exodeoxyribonuclease I [Candidatus Purcelliella pentastirinorum]
MIKNTFLFYDYETFGINPSLDKPAQFAAIRTDFDFNIIDKPKIYYCKLPDDYLPNPESVLTHKISPQKANLLGVSESKFAKLIYKLFLKKKNCIIGYNNIKFDDFFTRNIFYRNFFHPYMWSWYNGNNNWDLINIIRSCYLLCPKNIKWPYKKNGIPSFRLEDFVKINKYKNIDSHDAMSDVYATILIIKSIKKKKPKFFNFLFNNRKKNQLLSLIKKNKNIPFIYISNIFDVKKNIINIILPIKIYKKNVLVALNIMKDISLFLNNNINDKEKYLFNKNKKSSIIEIYLNKCPIIIPINLLNEISCKRLKINKKKYMKNIDFIKKYKIHKKIKNIYDYHKINDFKYKDNIDCQLYKRFFTNKDYQLMEIIRKTNVNKLKLIDLDKYDERFKNLLFRYRARNFYYTLNNTEKKKWDKHKKKYFNFPYIKNYLIKIKKLHLYYKNNLNNQKLLKKIYSYTKYLINLIN